VGEEKRSEKSSEAEKKKREKREKRKKKIETWASEPKGNDARCVIKMLGRS